MALESQPLVSVVTPVYNAEKYLAECVESVLAQTYENWEYVIVDNCSTDRSLEIAQHYAQQEIRIRVHENDDFLNQMQNWNHTLRQISAESKYCKVVHADDWLFPECITRMVELAEAHPSVGIVGAYRLDEDRVNLDRLPYPSVVIPGRKVCRLSLLDGLSVFGSPTSLLIRSDIVRNRPTFYDEHTIHADTQICFDILQSSDFGFVHQVLTYTRRHNETITSVMRRFNTHRLVDLVILKEYGPVYLSSEEYEHRLEQVLENYYRFLGRSVFGLRERQFWNYHKDGLKNLGHPFRWPRLIKATFLILLNFRDAFRMLRQAVNQRKNDQDPEKLNAVLSSIYTEKDSES